jgi:hypothetical protein
MSRQRKKDQKRERLERARKKRLQLEARREAQTQKREERRTAGMTALQKSRWSELFYGPLTRRALAWCGLGFLISMALIFFVVLPVQLLSGRRSAPPVFYYVMLLFIPSVFGMLLFAWLDHRRKGGQFGRGQDIHEKLNLSSSSSRTVKIKEHTTDVLTLVPVRSFQVFGWLCLVLSAIWYIIIFVSWLLVPNVFGQPGQHSLLELALPFALPLPFVFVGIACFSLPETFVFDRKAERLRIINWWQKKILLLSDIRSIQIIEGNTECIPESDMRDQHSYSTVQLNLVMSDPKFPRLNISNDADRQAAAETGLTLSRFLNIPLDDVTGMTET